MNKYGKIVIFILFLAYALFTTSDGDKMREELKNASNEIKNVQKVEAEKEDKADKGKLEVTFIDVGQADSILIRFEDEYTLIDAGNNSDGKELVKYFKELNIDKFKYVIATHAHEDHIGGMDDIIENFKIENFYIPDRVSTTITFEEVLDALDKKDLVFDSLETNETFSLKDAKFDVIYANDTAEDLNDTSTILRLEYEDVSFLFMGDASNKVENNILKSNIKSDVIKIAHHGSLESSSTAFLNKVLPSYAVISVGENNKFNHPSKTILDRLAKLNTTLYRTDLNGNISFETDGFEISVKTEKEKK